MTNSKKNNEQKIMEAAEAEFIEKGYGNTKTTDIAKKAGVSHSMLHYYFRTKENIFQKVFQDKISLFSNSLIPIYDRNLSFEDTLRAVTESHFNFFMKNPNLFIFIFNEIKGNEQNGKILRSILIPKLTAVLKKMTNLIETEIEKGNIKNIKPYDLILNIISLNISTFIFSPFFNEISLNILDNEELLLERRESNVQFILNALRN